MFLEESLWSDETTNFNCLAVMISVKHEGGSIMLCGCFTGKRNWCTGIDGIMRKEDYIMYDV